jgi:Sec-independent protein translocase protein TatA
MNRGSLSIGKILLIAAVVVALLIFARPFLSGMGKDTESAVDTNQEMTQGAVDTVAPAPVDTQPTPEAVAPSDSTAPNANPEQMTPAPQDTVTEPAPATVPPTNN